jgi:hypothetical protein
VFESPIWLNSNLHSSLGQYLDDHFKNLSSNKKEFQEKIGFTKNCWMKFHVGIKIKGLEKIKPNHANKMLGSDLVEFTVEMS